MKYNLLLLVFGLACAVLAVLYVLTKSRFYHLGDYFGRFSYLQIDTPESSVRKISSLTKARM